MLKHGLKVQCIHWHPSIGGSIFTIMPRLIMELLMSETYRVVSIDKKEDILLILK